MSDRPPRLLVAAPSLDGSLSVPSDKSIAHRALICAALASGDSRIILNEPGEDVRSTVGALRALGAYVRTTELEDGFEVHVTGLGDGKSIGRLGAGTGDCGNSGTSMRLLAGALAGGSGTVTLVGDESLSRRPMARVADPLRSMGAEIYLEDGHAPMVVRGCRPLEAVEHELPVASAQVLGAILFAALAADGVTTVHVPGVVRDHTERLLGVLGVNVTRTVRGSGTTTTIEGPAKLQPQITQVPGDISSAAAWIVLGTVHPDARITMQHVGLNPSRTAVIDVLRSMGADIRVNEGESVGEPIGDIELRGGNRLHAISLGPDDVAPLIDELPLLAVAMAAADGVSEVRGASELRVKESDRIAAMCAALSAAGAHVEELPDGWRISRGKPRNAQISTLGDHRIAMAMAVAAWSGVASSVALDDPDCVAVSYPSFWDDARRVGAVR